MSENEIDVSRAKDGKVKLVFSSDIDLGVNHHDGKPPTKVPKGKTKAWLDAIEWLAYFDVRKNAKYKIKLTGNDKFVFWDGKDVIYDFTWRTSSEITGDPAIGSE